MSKKDKDSRIQQPSPLPAAAVQDRRAFFFQGDFFFSVDAGLVMARETRGLVPGTKGSDLLSLPVEGIQPNDGDRKRIQTQNAQNILNIKV